MKKTVVMLGILLGVVGTTQMNAQTISFGVKGEANMSNYIIKDLDGKSKLNFGAGLGGFMKWEISDCFALQPEVLVNYKNSKTENGAQKGNYEYWGAEIPVYALGQWSMGSGRMYAGVGPYVSCGFSLKDFPGDVDLYKKVNDESTLRRWDFGGGALVGYEFSNGIQINAGYKIGFLDMMDRGRDDASMNTQTISLGVGFRF